jgi:hypothetical protein
LEKLPIPIGLVIAEELREGVEEALKTVKREEATRTHVIRNQLVEGVFTFLSLTGRGRVRELLLMFDNHEVGLYVECDGRSLINHDFNELQDLSEVMEEIDAFERDGSYVFRIGNVSFLSSFSCIVKPKKRALIRQGMVIYDLGF